MRSHGTLIPEQTTVASGAWSALLGGTSSRSPASFVRDELATVEISEANLPPSS